MSTDGDDAGGSFWSTFGGNQGGPEATPLEQLLQSPDCSVEAVLDEEDVIQEFKACNNGLLTRLSQPDAALMLIEYITHEPPSEAPSARCFRYPFVAAELFSCGTSQFFDVFVGPDHPDLMDAFWSFLEATAPGDVNPVLAGYFARTAASLLAKYPHETVGHLRRRGTDKLLDRFLERLHSRSLAELFARLLCVEQPSQVVFAVEGLVLRLLDRLEDQSLGADTQENVTLIILELLAQKDSLCFGEELLKQLSAANSVGLLVSHIFCDRPSRVSAAASILSNVVFHAHVAPKGISHIASTPTLSPFSPPMTLTAEDDLVGVGDDEEALGEAALARTSATASPPRSPVHTPHRGDGSGSRQEAHGVALIREVSSHFALIRGLLDVVLDGSTTTSAPIGGVTSCGSTTLEVISLLTMTVRTGASAILDAILHEELLPRCFSIFFKFQWSTLLHNAVRQLISEVLCTSDSANAHLVCNLLREGGLGERLIAEYREDRDFRQGPRRRHPRVGYMGHLFSICSELREYSERMPVVGEVFESMPDWAGVVLPALDETLRIHGEQLGGGIHSEDRGLASSNATPSTADPASFGSREPDFHLDDLDGLEGDDGNNMLAEEYAGQDMSGQGRMVAYGAFSDTAPVADDDFDPSAFATEVPSQGSGAAADLHAGDQQRGAGTLPTAGAWNNDGWANFDDISTMGAPAANDGVDIGDVQLQEDPPPRSAPASETVGSFWDNSFGDSQDTASPGSKAELSEGSLLNILQAEVADDDAPVEPPSDWKADFGPSFPIPPSGGAATSPAAARYAVDVPQDSSPGAAQSQTWAAEFGASPSAALASAWGDDFGPSPTAAPTQAWSADFTADPFAASGGAAQAASAAPAAAPWPAAPATSSAPPEVGPENLFALLGDAPPAAAPAPVAAPAAAAAPASAVPAMRRRDTPLPEGIAEALGDSSPSAFPSALDDVPWPTSSAAAATPDWAAFDPLPPASAAGIPVSKSPSAAASDQSWVADFDPFGSPSSGDRSATASESAQWPPGSTPQAADKPAADKDFDALASLFPSAS